MFKLTRGPQEDSWRNMSMDDLWMTIKESRNGEKRVKELPTLGMKSD